MFVGSIDANTRLFFSNISYVLTGKRVFVGCSGNFSIESAIMAQGGKQFRVYSNDVSLYSAIIANFYLGRDMRVDVINDDFHFLEQYMMTPEDKAATIIVLLDWIKWYGKDGFHHRRMWRSFIRRFGEIHAKTKAGLYRLPIDGFYHGDVFDFFKENDDSDAVFITFPPTYAGGYERLFAAFDDIFDYERPDYPILDDARRDELIKWLVERNFFYGDDRRLDLPLVCLSERVGMRPLFTYSNMDVGKMFFGAPKLAPITNYNVADYDIDLSDAKISLVVVRPADVLPYKFAYMPASINPVTGQLAIAVIAKNSIVGFLEFSISMYRRSGHDVYLLSDFAVPTKYKRLSKLIAMLSVSADVLDIIKTHMLISPKRVFTTAFTDKPVSMKYRGVFKVSGRGKSKRGKFVNYEGVFKNLSAQEVFELWKEKHSHVLKKR